MEEDTKKIEAPITLVAVIEEAQHEALRRIAFAERRSLADVVREAIDKLIAEKSRKAPAPLSLKGAARIVASRGRKTASAK